MKKLIYILLAFCLIVLVGCGGVGNKPKYEVSEATYDFHKDFIERLVAEGLLMLDDYLSDAWIKKCFVESWIRVKEIDGRPDVSDVECYIHLKVDNILTTNNRYFRIHFPNFPNSVNYDVREASLLSVKTLFGFSYTDKVDKKWS